MIKNQWYAIASSKEIKKNKITSMIRLNEKLVLFRDDKNKVHAISDKCSHRGASLSKGKVKANCVQCPFHGIVFNEKGECVKIPALGENFQKNLERFNIKRFYVMEKYGIIYLYNGDTPKDYNVPFFKELENNKLKYSEITDCWNTHYTRVIENQLDVIHLPFIHHNTIGRGNKTLVNGPKVLYIDDLTIQTSANNENDHGQKPLKPDESIIKDTFLKFRFPNIWLNHVSDKIMIFIFFAPVDNENTKLYIRFYNNITGISPIDSFIAFIGRYMNDIIQKQDKRVVITEIPKETSLKINENLLQGDMPVIEFRKIRESLKNKEEN